MGDLLRSEPPALRNLIAGERLCTGRQVGKEHVVPFGKAAKMKKVVDS
jgi:hypothetical protein